MVLKVEVEIMCLFKEEFVALMEDLKMDMVDVRGVEVVKWYL